MLTGYLLSVGVATHVNGEVVPLDRRYDHGGEQEIESVGLVAFNMVVEVHEQFLHA